MKKYFQEFKYNFNLAMPVILGMVGHTLVGVVDNIFVGQLGSTELVKKEKDYFIHISY